MELRSIVNPNGHDFVGKPNLDAVGVTYITFAVLYTLVVLAGLVALWIHRHNEVVRLRSVPLSFTAIATLQVYLVLVLAVYPENGLFACGTEFWIMSIALPFGMGLFQGKYHLMSPLRALANFHSSLQRSGLLLCRTPGTPHSLREFGKPALAEAAVPLHASWPPDCLEAAFFCGKDICWHLYWVRYDGKPRCTSCFYFSRPFFFFR